MKGVSEHRLCKRCGTWKPILEFGESVHHTEGRRYWCKPCYKAYQKEYRRKKKWQPSWEEHIQVETPEPRDDTTIYLDNRRRHAKRKGNKPTCKAPGCITRLNYLQRTYCMVHEAEENGKRLDRRVARVK